MCFILPRLGCSSGPHLVRSGLKINKSLGLINARTTQKSHFLCFLTPVHVLAILGGDWDGVWTLVFEAVDLDWRELARAGAFSASSSAVCVCVYACI